MTSTESCLSDVECRLVASISLDFFASGLRIRTAIARLSLRQLGFLVEDPQRFTTLYHEMSAFLNKLFSNQQIVSGVVGCLLINLLQTYCGVYRRQNDKNL